LPFEEVDDKSNGQIAKFKLCNLHLSYLLEAQLVQYRTGRDRRNSEENVILHPKEAVVNLIFIAE
jgi:hypothetical protein